MDLAAAGLAFALTSAFFLGANKLAVRVLLFKMDESFASLIAILLALPLFGAPILLFGLGGPPPSWTAIAVLAAAGVLNFSVGRVFVWRSIGAVGANRGNILASAQVVFALAIAMLLLKQTVDFYTGSGIALVLLGILIISLGGFRGTAFTSEQLRTGVLYGMLGAFLWGISQVLMQVGIQLETDATVATFLTYVAAFVGMVPILFFVDRRSGERNTFRTDRRSVLMVVVAGLLGNFGLYFRYIALQTIPLTVVSTINATNPVITLVLSGILIRELERIDRSTVVAICFSVAGVFLMAL